MALIIKCRSCRKRIKSEYSSCPFCQSSEYRFIIDYWPDGRHGKRVRFPLDEKIIDIEIARSIEINTRIAAREARRSEDLPVSPKSMLKELIPDYLEWFKLHRTRATCAERLYTIKHIEKILGDVPATQININHINIYKKIRHGQGASNKTINKEMYYISGILKWCRDHKNMDIRPPKIEKLPYSRPIPMVLSTNEISRLLGACEGFHKVFILCLYTLGLRFSEARFLKWNDIDFSNMTIRVVQKGGSYKMLPLNDQLALELKSLQRKDKSEYVFVSRRTGKSICDIRKSLMGICQRAGIRKKVNPHLFRHSIATHMMAAGINLRTIQAYLGHSQIGTTEFYTHVAMEHLRDATERILKDVSTGIMNDIK
jgi:site-specific recombinase XerD